ncbi:MAG TPA: hypothetical protein VKV34_01465 [Thermoleophilia bacterium]|nr:hypothetical protein [Thermoleophilia bacterium]
MSSLHSPSTTRRSTPSRRGRAGLAATAVVLTAAPFAAACGAGFNAASLVVKPNAAAGTIGDMKINNVWVIVDPATGTAEVIGAVTNTGSADDQLVSVSADGNFATVVKPTATTTNTAPAVATGAGVTVSGETVTIPAGESASFGEAASPELEIIGAGFIPGTIAPVKLTFAQAGSITLSAQVETNTGMFARYNPNAAAPSASPNPSASASRSASAAASASASASNSAAASGSASASASPSATK